MERGLLWLPLLGLFGWLAWAGWNEYQKVEAYRQWANQFERAKYDIYAVLGQRGDQLVWGKPTRQAPIELQSVTLDQIDRISLTIGGQPAAPFGLPQADEAPNSPTATPHKGKVAIQFSLTSGEQRSVPFTDRALAEQWYRFLAPRVVVR
ncbi:MAG: hypothetical protein AAFY78_05020 [Cyanobacteria bacterium J06648_16]